MLQLAVLLSLSSVSPVIISSLSLSLSRHSASTFVDVVRVAILVIVIRARERVEEVEVLCAQLLDDGVQPLFAART